MKGRTEPRIFTRPLRPLTSATSLGFAAIEFATDVCGVQLYPWQEWLLKHALELLPDGSFRYRTVVVLVARQQGKSMLSVILSLFFMYVLGTDLVIGTAQDLDVAEEIWQEAVDLVDDVDELRELRGRVVKVNGKKSLDLKTGERYKVKAANRRAGRGLSGDLVLLDELREHQSWDAWGAVTHTAMARPNAQIWALSNAGDATSIVLRYLRKMAHQALGDPDGICAAEDPSRLLEDAPEDVGPVDESLGLFEWSSPAGADIHDVSALAYANPALGYGLVTARSLAAAAATDPEWVFRTECMCQWSDGTLEGPFPPGTWDAGRWDGKGRPPQIVGTVKACVDVTPDRGRAHIAFCGMNDRNRPQVEVVASRAGVEWVSGWLSARLDVVDEVTGQGRGAQVSELLEVLEKDGIPVTRWEGGDLTAGTGRFFDAVRDDELDHLPQPILDVAAATAVPKIMSDGAFLWDRRKSPVDACPLIAVTGAFWLLTRRGDGPSVYEERGFLSLSL